MVRLTLTTLAVLSLSVNARAQGRLGGPRGAFASPGALGNSACSARMTAAAGMPSAGLPTGLTMPGNPLHGFGTIAAGAGVNSNLAIANGGFGGFHSMSGMGPGFGPNPGGLNPMFGSSPFAQSGNGFASYGTAFGANGPGAVGSMGFGINGPSANANSNGQDAGSGGPNAGNDAGRYGNGGNDPSASVTATTEIAHRSLAKSKGKTSRSRSRSKKTGRTRSTSN